MHLFRHRFTQLGQLAALSNDVGDDTFSDTIVFLLDICDIISGVHQSRAAETLGRECREKNGRAILVLVRPHAHPVLAGSH